MTPETQRFETSPFRAGRGVIDLLPALKRDLLNYKLICMSMFFICYNFLTKERLRINYEIYIHAHLYFSITKSITGPAKLLVVSRGHECSNDFNNSSSHAITFTST